MTSRSRSALVCQLVELGTSVGSKKSDNELCVAKMAATKVLKHHIGPQGLTEIAGVENAGVRSMECQTVLLANDMFNTTQQSDDA